MKMGIVGLMPTIAENSVGEAFQGLGLLFAVKGNNRLHSADTTPKGHSLTLATTWGTWATFRHLTSCVQAAHLE